MKWCKIRNFIVWAIVLVISIILTVTGLEKLSHYAVFRAQLNRSPWNLLSLHSFFFAWMVPLSELAIAMLLLKSVTRLWGFVGAASLFTVFSGYMLWIWINKIKVTCGCNVFIEKLTLIQHIWLNLTIAVISVIGLLLTGKRISKI